MKRLTSMAGSGLRLERRYESQAVGSVVICTAGARLLQADRAAPRSDSIQRLKISGVYMQRIIIGWG